MATDNVTYEARTWFERDRAMVSLIAHANMEEVEVATWWDEDVCQLVEDGFLDPRDWTGSSVEYATHLGMI